MPPKSTKTQVKEVKEMKDTKETKPKKVTSASKKTKKEPEPEPEPVLESDNSEQEHSEQEHSEQEHSEQEDKWEEDESEMLRVKAQCQQESKEEVKDTKVSEATQEEVVKQQVQTFKKPQGRRFNTSGDSTQKPERQSNGKFHYHNKTNEQYNKTNEQYNKTNEQSTFKKPRSAALSFAYKDYRELTHPASNVTTVDLLRMLIVRSTDDGQTKLKHCLEDTLRAINLECKFPTIPRFTPQTTQL